MGCAGACEVGRDRRGARGADGDGERASGAAGAGGRPPRLRAQPAPPVAPTRGRSRSCPPARSVRSLQGCWRGSCDRATPPPSRPGSRPRSNGAGRPTPAQVEPSSGGRATDDLPAADPDAGDGPAAGAENAARIGDRPGRRAVAAIAAPAAAVRSARWSQRNKCRASRAGPPPARGWNSGPGQEVPAERSGHGQLGDGLADGVGVLVGEHVGDGVDVGPGEARGWRRPTREGPEQLRLARAHRPA